MEERELVVNGQVWSLRLPLHPDTVCFDSKVQYNSLTGMIGKADMDDDGRISFSSLPM